MTQVLLVKCNHLLIKLFLMTILFTNTFQAHN